MNGNLALSRAIGDFEFKKSADLPPEQQIVTAFPDVEIHDINQDDEFLVVACDGNTTLKLPATTALICHRYLGLSIIPSRHRVREARYCRKAGSCLHLREHDGQLLGFKQ